MKIIQITDTHLFKNNEDEILSVKSNQTFIEVMNKVKAENPDFLFLTGDISQDETPESYQKIVEKIDELNIDTYWIPGNHDDIGIMNKVFNQSKYIKRVDHLSSMYWDCIFLNTKLEGSASGKLDEGELTKLSHLLNNSKAAQVAIIMHHHPIKVSTPLIDQYILQNQHDFWDLVDQHKKIKLIICGHVHGDYAIKRDQIMIESGPATCLQWEKGTSDLKIDKTIGYKKYQFDKKGYHSEAIIWR